MSWVVLELVLVWFFEVADDAGDVFVVEVVWDGCECGWVGFHYHVAVFDVCAA